MGELHVQDTFLFPFFRDELVYQEIKLEFKQNYA
jgi:hypothetical protein